MSENKQCKNCQVEKTPEEYYIYTHKKTGKKYLFAMCKCCIGEDRRNKYRNDENYHKKVREYQKQYKQKFFFKSEANSSE